MQPRGTAPLALHSIQGFTTPPARTVSSLDAAWRNRDWRASGTLACGGDVGPKALFHALAPRDNFVDRGNHQIRALILNVMRAVRHQSVGAARGKRRKRVVPADGRPTRILELGIVSPY
jgi:hypothetical protein